MNNNIVISTPPHVKTNRTTKKIMLDVIIALAPAAIAGIVFYLWNALILEVVAVAGAVCTEFVYYFLANGGCKNPINVCKKWWKQFDYTSIVTGLIIALIVPASVKWFEVLIGSVFAIALVKMLFGGTGKNLVNPAAAGRVFMQLSFASVTAFAAVTINVAPVTEFSEITTGATYLQSMLGGTPVEFSYIDLFLGTGLIGCIGETCKLAILIGYVYLVVRHVIKWWQPVLYIGLSALLSVCFASIGGSFDISLFPAYAFGGGLMFGAVFMATDYVTSPKGTCGQIVYYVLLALLTSALRAYKHIEVVSFVILLCNLIVPLIDTYVVRKPFGYKREKKAKEAK